MERNRNICPGIRPNPEDLYNTPRYTQECPILCITKSIVFVLVTVFVLYLPLGDPEVHCSNTKLLNDSEALCSLCDLHKFMIKIARRTTNLIQYLFCESLRFLYEAKLKFYTLLEKIDRDDLCYTVCCSGESIGDNNENTIRRTRPPCRCVKKKCRKN